MTKSGEFGETQKPEEVCKDKTPGSGSPTRTKHVKKNLTKHNLYSPVHQTSCGGVEKRQNISY